MAFSPLLAVPAAAVVVLAVVGAWLDGSDSTATVTGASVPVAESAAPAVSAAVAPTATACQSVVHIGDSTSIGLIDPRLIADPAQRVGAQYRRVGVLDARTEISGARSVVETVADQVNAYDTAAAIKAAGYEGCWVLALGTTDTANVAAGGAPGRAGRIDRMLEAIGDDPIMWVTAKTLVADGDPWSNTNMQEWNRELAAAATRYPNLRVYDWAAVVRDAWFQSDGIHYTSTGYAERARRLADALASSWPADQ